MKMEVEILITEDDEGHAHLIKKNLRRTGIKNKIRHFMDGQEVLNFLLKKENGSHMVDGTAYLLLLDIRMPRVSGVEVLAKIKAHEELRKIPTVMITTSDNPAEIERCHDLGCSSYISKPIKYEDFIKAVKHLGLFLSIIRVPRIGEPVEEETTKA